MLPYSLTPGDVRDKGCGKGHSNLPTACLTGGRHLRWPWFGGLGFVMAYCLRRLRPLFYLLVLSAAIIGSALPARADGPPLWRVAAGEVTFHILGTIHMLPRDFEWMTPEIITAFEASDSLVLENAFEQKDSRLVRFIIAQKGTFKDGKTLKDEIGEEEYLRFVRQADAFDLPERVLRFYKPWVASVVVAGLVAKTHEIDPNYGVERVLMREAQRAGKPLKELEELFEHYSFLSDLPMDVQVKMLKQTLDDLATLSDAFGKLVTAWSQGDLEALEGFMHQNFADSPELYEQLLPVRNRLWISRIKKLARQRDGSFIAVGAAHLIGPDSLITMLEAEGYEIERIDNQGKPIKAPDQRTR
jgi:uncharacterized protein YbaP (TraB family)